MYNSLVKKHLLYKKKTNEDKILKNKNIHTSAYKINNNKKYINEIPIFLEN